MHKFNTHRKLKDNFLDQLPEEDRKYFMEYVALIILLSFSRPKKTLSRKNTNNTNESWCTLPQTASSRSATW